MLYIFAYMQDGVLVVKTGPFFSGANSLVYLHIHTYICIYTHVHISVRVHMYVYMFTGWHAGGKRRQASVSAYSIIITRF